MTHTTPNQTGKERKKQCRHCNSTGKVWSSFLGNYVPCETENECGLNILTQPTIREEFDLMWGFAPKGSLKYKKGEEVWAFFSYHLHKEREENIQKGFYLVLSHMLSHTGDDGVLYRTAMDWRECKRLLRKDLQKLLANL